jgi:5-methylcytosine-specific restriction enzyme subunit McrC
MLLNICYFVLDGLLLSTDKGQYKMAMFLDEQHMSQLFEKFVLEYYRYHFPELRATSSQIKWNVDDDIIDFLPIMQTDVTLRFSEKILIIDTKYYSRTMQVQHKYDSSTLRSSHLYQIFTYVKNMDAGNTGDVAGMLLYAKTDEAITPDFEYKMGGNRISVKILDLSISFPSIAAQLDEIVTSYFGYLKKNYA